MAAGGLLVLVMARRGCSGERGERADRVEDGGEVVLPGPAGGHPECPLAAGADQAGRNGEELAASGAGGLDGLVGLPDLAGPAAEVVRDRGDHGPGAVGVHPAGREVTEGLVFEVADREPTWAWSW